MMVIVAWLLGKKKKDFCSIHLVTANLSVLMNIWHCCVQLRWFLLDTSRHVSFICVDYFWHCAIQLQWFLLDTSDHITCICVDEYLTLLYPATVIFARYITSYVVHLLWGIFETPLSSYRVCSIHHVIPRGSVSIILDIVPSSYSDFRLIHHVMLCASVLIHVWHY